MTLPTSGPLSLGAIRNEQVNNVGLTSTYALRGLSANAGFSSPDSVSEFYGYGLVTSGLALYLDASNTSSYSGSGGTWNDLSGNGNNMTMLGTVPINGTGKTKYFSYNGTPDYFQGVNNFLNANSGIIDQITISVVASITDMSQRTALFSKYQNNPAYVLEVGTIPGLWSSTMRWYASGVNDQGVDLRGTQPLNQNQIYVFTLTMNRNTISTIAYYNNLVLSSTIGGFPPGLGADWAQGNTPFLTGSYGGGLRINGYMNEYMVLVYNRALSAGEISSNYNALKPRFGI
jgi:hypothetical protein